MSRGRNEVESRPPAVLGLRRLEGLCPAFGEEFMNLTPKQQMLMRMLRQSRPQKEIAVALGVSESAVSRLRGRLKAKLKSFFDEFPDAAGPAIEALLR